MAREITHASIWIFTPLLILAGVPMWLVGIGWAINFAAVAVGAQLAKHFIERWSEARLFAVPMLLTLIVLVILASHVSWWTVWLYAVCGLVRGWVSAVMPPIIQHRAPNDIQSTVFSVGSSLSQVLYVIAVIVVNLAGNYGVQWALVANVLLFAPLVAVVAIRLYRFG